MIDHLITYQYLSTLCNKIVRSQSSLQPLRRHLHHIFILLLIEDGMPHVLDIDGGLVLGLAVFL